MTDRQKSALFWVMLLAFTAITTFTILGYFTSFIKLADTDKDWLGKALFTEFTIAFFSFLYQGFKVKKGNNDALVNENSTPTQIDTASIIENIKDDVRDLFTDRNFIKHYKKDSLFQVTETLLTEICKRNFNGLEALLTKEIIDIISIEKGFYSKLDIIYETQVLQDDTIQTTTTRKMYGEIKDSILKGSMKIDILPNKKREEQLFLLEIKINEQSINIKDIDSSYDDDPELSKQNKIRLNFNINLTNYSKIDSIESKIVTIEKASNIHTLSINRPTKNLSVEYIYNPKHIKNPNFVSKYGETDLANLIKEPLSEDKAHIKYNYGNKVFLPKEFFFIYYERNEEVK